MKRLLIGLLLLAPVGASAFFFTPGGGSGGISRLKTFSFAIDNVAATDNVLMWRAPVAITITQANCYASADNVIGNLMECGTDDVTSCTVLDAWTVTNAVNDFTDASMTDGAVAAGAWIRWSTTSVGSALNRLTCTIQYNE